MNKDVSPTGTITKTDWKSIAKGFLVTLGGAGATYVAATLGSIDWSTYGKYGPFLAVVAALVINILRKWLSSTEGKKE